MSKENNQAGQEPVSDGVDDGATPPEVIASRLIDAWCTTYKKPIPWAKAIEITAIVTKMPDVERIRLLSLDDDLSSAPIAPAQDEEPEELRQKLKSAEYVKNMKDDLIAELRAQLTTAHAAGFAQCKEMAIAVCHSEYQRLESAGKTHIFGSQERARCYSGARAASNCILDIRALQCPDQPAETRDIRNGAGELVAIARKSAAPKASEQAKCLPHGLRYQMPPLDLTGHQIMHLAAMARGADSLDAVWRIKDLEPKSATHDDEACKGGIGATTEGQPGWALLSTAFQASEQDKEGAENFRWLRDKCTWSVDLVREDGQPFKKCERFAAGFTKDMSGLTAEWSVAFNTDYGMNEDEDDLSVAIIAARASQEKANG